MQQRRRVRLQGKYRLITRSDFDGLVCGMLCQEAGVVDSILFAHPKDMQDGTVEVDDRDIIAGLPYVSGCALCFDIGGGVDVPESAHEDGTFVNDSKVSSVARLTYQWFGGRLAFPRIDQAMLAAVDKAHQAQYTRDEILDPKDWVLLAFLMDARTGLGRFREFRLSNYQLMLELIPFCRAATIQDILKHPDVVERIHVYADHQVRCREQLQRCIKLQGKVGVLDLREEDTIWAGNRFLVYALFPDIAVSVHVIWGLRRQNTVFAVGRSILNNDLCLDIGAIMAQHGGGGHSAAGTCQVPHDLADRKLREIVTALNA